MQTRQKTQGVRKRSFMGLFHFFTKLNINDGVKAFRNNPNAVLLDVRTIEEYTQGHIEGSKNIPLQTIERVQSEIPEKSTLLYVYCRSGVRSAKATELLQKAGYTNVIDIGGIIHYKGEIVKN
jgi:rhodanese-related sulfurtransferase